MQCSSPGPSLLLSSVLGTGGGGAVPQSIELKDNAAYSTIQTQSAPHSQSIALNDNVAYRTTTEKTDSL